MPTAILNAETLFMFQVIRPLPDPISGKEQRHSRGEQVAAARLYVQVFSDGALLRAIDAAKEIPLAHGERWDPFWDDLVRSLHQRRVA